MFQMEGGKPSRRRWNGSFTIEAAVVVPIIMLIFMAVIYLAFYAYDQVTVTAAAEYAVFDQAERSLMGTGGSGAVDQALSGRLMSASGVSLSVSGDADHCAAEASAGFHIPLLMIDQLTGGALKTIHSSMDRHAFDGRKKLLLYKSISDGAKDVTGR